MAKKNVVRLADRAFGRLVEVTVWRGYDHKPRHAEVSWAIPCGRSISVTEAEAFGRNIAKACKCARQMNAEIAGRRKAGTLRARPDFVLSRE